MYAIILSFRISYGMLLFGGAHLQILQSPDSSGIWCRCRSSNCRSNAMHYPARIN